MSCLKSRNHKSLSQILTEAQRTVRPCAEGGLGARCPLLSGSFWNEKLLQEVCAGLAEELQLPPDAPGGMVEFRRTLTLSFFFKFYLTVLQKLGKEHPEDVSGAWAGRRLSAARLFGALRSWSG